ncbi:MAG: 50S ribosomal protein L18 [Bacteriovoracaceae bacterium]
MRKSLAKIKNPSKAKEYRRKLSIRKKIIGTADMPRLCAVKTNMHLQVQVVDDAAMKTLFSVQTFGKKASAKSANIEGAKELGKVLAAQLKKNKIEQAVFDRNGKLYTGAIAALADSLRENGIKI